MAFKKIDDTILTDIANAIRQKAGTITKYYPSEMAQAIKDLVIAHLTTATVTPTKETQEITPPSSYEGLSKVTVNPIPSEYYDTSEDDAVVGDVLSGKKFHTSTGSETGSMTNNGDTSGTISTVAGCIVIPAGYTSGGTVQISSTEQEKIVAGNIKQGVTILGVCGTVNPTPPLKNVTVKSTTSEDEVDAGEGYYGIGTVTVSPISLETVNVTLGTTAQQITASCGYDAIGTVNVPAAQTDNLPGVLFSTEWQYITLNAPSGLSNKKVTGFANIKSLTFPDATEIGDLAFFGTNQLLSISGQCVTIVGSGAFNSSGVQSFTFPSLTQIKSYAFYNCQSLVTMPSLQNVTEIGDYAFGETGLTGDVTLPKITSIGAGAFETWGTYKIQNLTISNTDGVCTLGDSSAIPSTTNIYVPAALVDAYKAATNWSTHASKISAIT